MSDHENADKHRPEDSGASGRDNSGEAENSPERHRRRGGKCGEWGWWEERSLPVKIVMGICFGIVGIGFLFLCGWVTMTLWNWLMPDLFGLKRLTYWQAWGLFILCKILFGGCGSRSNGGRRERRRKRQLRRYMREDQAKTMEASESE